MKRRRIRIEMQETGLASAKILGRLEPGGPGLAERILRLGLREFEISMNLRCGEFNAVKKSQNLNFFFFLFQRKSELFSQN